MRSCMRPQQLPLIHVITVRLGPTRMIQRNQQIIEILRHRNDRMLIIVNTKQRIAFGVDKSFVEIVDDLLPDNRNGMIWLQENVASNIRVDLGRHIGPGISVVGFGADLQGFRSGLAMGRIRTGAQQTTMMLVGEDMETEWWMLDDSF